MTVTFNTQLAGAPPQFNLDDLPVVTVDQLEKSIKVLLKQPLKQYPVSHWWVTRVYHTTSDKPPIKWQPHDYACYGTMADVESGFIDWIGYLGKNTYLTGFKVCTMRLDMLNGTSTVESQFSKEHFQPKEKIFINGPKKKPFPAKAAKHYQV